MQWYRDLPAEQHQQAEVVRGHLVGRAVCVHLKPHGAGESFVLDHQRDAPDAIAAYTPS
jgi:hypothetical protein